MRRIIDAHVHITPAAALGMRNDRFGTENRPYGYLKMGDGGFQTMPCYIRDSQFTDDTLVHMMDVYGVEKAVILQSLMAPQNAAVAAAVLKHPGRLSGAMVLEPTPGWREELNHWHSCGLNVIKFEMRAYTNPSCYPDARYDDTEMTAVFDEAEHRRMTVTIDPAPADFPVYQPEAFERAVRSHPDLHFVLCHLGYPHPLDKPEAAARWENMIRAACHPNCWIDVSAMPDLFDAEGWPYPTALSLFRRVRDLCGPKRLIWGSDIPGTLNRATYPQMLDMFIKRAGLSESELDALLYENACEAYYL